MSERDFELFRDMIFDIADISLAAGKKALVAGRLAKRQKHYALTRYGDYFRLISDPANRQELQIAVDLLTTNKTYFFREEKHFDYLRREVVSKRLQGRPFHDQSFRDPAWNQRRGTTGDISARMNLTIIESE